MRDSVTEGRRGLLMEEWERNGKVMENGWKTESLKIIYNKILLDQIAKGALTRQVNDELRRVIDNITDPQADPKPTRKIIVTLECSLIADGSINIVANVESKLVKRYPANDTFFFSIDDKTRDVEMNGMLSETGTDSNQIDAWEYQRYNPDSVDQ